MKSLQAWLAQLEQLHPTAIELGLERVGRVAQKLGLAAVEPKIITVAGTNGKGSCVATMEQLLIDAGYRVGAYTSPHLQHYCERIRLHGQAVAEAAVCDAFARIDAARGDTSLTYFEFGTLAAVDIFLAAPAALDVILLEVGLGGRLDAVNLWDADVAVVTSIGLDHQAWLGHDREAIGREKAGIFRPGRPAICADESPPATIAEVAVETGALLLSIGQQFDFHTAAGTFHTAVGTSHTAVGTSHTAVGTWRFSGCGPQGDAVQFDALDLPGLPLPSVAAGLQALFSAGLALPESTIRAVLPRLALPGRMQSLTYRGVRVVLDVAHNPDAAEYLCRQLGQRPVAGTTYGVLAMMADKDLNACLGVLGNEVDTWFVADLDGVERAASAAQLRQVLTRQRAEVCACDTVAGAFERAVALAEPTDRVLVVGSFYTVAAVLAVCGKRADADI